MAVFEKSGYGYVRQENPYTQKSKDDTWCKVDILTERQVYMECYTPQMGHGISVHNSLGWTREQFKGDYSGVPVMINKIRDEHRRASNYLKSARSARGECTGEPCWEEIPKK